MTETIKLPNYYDPDYKNARYGSLEELKGLLLYKWPEKLDDDADRIMLEYRTKGKVGRDKIAVRKALYKAYALGV